MTAIRVDRLLAPFLGLRYRQVVTVRRVMALVDTLWVSSCYLPYNLKFHDYHWFGDTPTLLCLVFKDISYVV